MQHTTILGSRVPVVTMDEAVDEVERMIAAGPGQCQPINNTGFHGIWEGHKNPEFREILNAAPFWVPDGVAVPLIARLRGQRMRRIAGPDFVKRMLERSEVNGYRSFFFGDSDETLAALRRQLERDYPRHEIAGMFSPPFREISPEEDQAHVDLINDAAPDILWVGLGCPKQERWIAEHKDRLRVPVAIGIGAIFGFLSGRVKRAPDWVGRLGLEWAYRVATEPRKCWRRSLVEGPKFVAAVARESLTAQHQH